MFKGRARMTEIIKGQKITGIKWSVVLSLLLMACMGCKAPAKPFTIGIVITVPIHAPCLYGLKTGMRELGYIEGKNIKYIYKGPIGTKDATIDAEIRNLLSQDIDLLFTTGSQVLLRAKQVLNGTGIPVVFSAAGMLNEENVLQNLQHPGGNITGVKTINLLPNVLEWLKIIKPGTKKVYLPYNPDDRVSVLNLQRLEGKNLPPGIELFVQKIHSVEEVAEAIEKLPADVDAVFRIPSPTLDPKNSILSQAAIKRGLPMMATVPLDEDVLITITGDFFEMGRQAARLAHQIHMGIKPADIPVETSEVFFTINLRTAKKIGLHIPDEVLLQAKKIIR
jgi:putative ABC transport system substrate-binding protein